MLVTARRRRRRISSDVSLCIDYLCHVGGCFESDYAHLNPYVVRKNNVIRGYTTFNASGNRSSQPKIRLVEELAKETDRLRQLQQEQENLAREQELADELFNDSGVAKSGRKRGAGSMTQYLSQKTTTKRGRGRR